MRRLCVAVVLSGLAAAPRTQDPLAWVRQDALVVAECDGFGKLNAAFAGTRLGKLLANKKFQGMLAPVNVAMQMAVGNLKRHTELDVDHLQEQLTGYRGRVRIAFDLLTDEISVDEPPPMAGIMLLGRDDTTDLASIAKSISEALEQSDLPATKQDLEVDGKTYRVLLAEADAGITFPQMVDGNLVVFSGKPLSQGIAHFVRGSESKVPSETAAQANATMRLDGRRAMQLIKSLVDARASARGQTGADSAEANAIFDAVGLDTIGSIEATLRPQGEHAVVETNLEFTAEPKGMLTMYLPERPGRPEFLDLVPRTAETWFAGTMNLTRLYDTFAGAIEAIGDGAGISIEQIEGGFQENTGLRLRQDVLDHLGSECLFTFDLDDYFAGVVNEDGPPGGVCYGLGLRDAAALEKSLAKMIRDQGMDEAITHDDYKGRAVHTLEEAELAWAFGDRWALIGVGASGRSGLQAILDQQANQSGGQSGEFPPGIPERLAAAGADGDGYCAMQIAGLIEAALQTAKAQGQLPPVGEKLGRTTVSLLREHKLEHMAMMIRTNRQGMFQRLVW